MDDVDLEELTAALRTGLSGGAGHDEVLWTDRASELLVHCAQAAVEAHPGGFSITVHVSCDEEPSLMLRVLLVAPVQTAGGEPVVAAHTTTPGPVAARWGPVLERVAANALFGSWQDTDTSRLLAAADIPMPAKDRP